MLAGPAVAAASRTATDLPDQGQGPIAQLGVGRLDDVLADQGGRRPDAIGLGGTGRAAGQVVSQGRGLGRVAGIEPFEAIRLESGQLEQLASFAVLDHPSTVATAAGSSTGMNPGPSAERIRRSARRVRVLTVPIGQPSRSAISLWLSSSR